MNDLGNEFLQELFYSFLSEINDQLADFKKQPIVTNFEKNLKSSFLHSLSKLCLLSEDYLLIIFNALVEWKNLNLRKNIGSGNKTKTKITNFHKKKETKIFYYTPKSYFEKELKQNTKIQELNELYIEKLFVQSIKKLIFLETQLSIKILKVYLGECIKNLEKLTSPQKLEKKDFDVVNILFSLKQEYGSIISILSERSESEVEKILNEIQKSNYKSYLCAVEFIYLPLSSKERIVSGVELFNNLYDNFEKRNKAHLNKEDKDKEKENKKEKEEIRIKILNVISNLLQKISEKYKPQNIHEQVWLLCNQKIIKESKLLLNSKQTLIKEQAILLYCSALGCSENYMPQEEVQHFIKSISKFNKNTEKNGIISQSTTLYQSILNFLKIYLSRRDSTGSYELFLRNVKKIIEVIFSSTNRRRSILVLKSYISFNQNIAIYYLIRIFEIINRWNPPFFVSKILTQLINAKGLYAYSQILIALKCISFIIKKNLLLNKNNNNIFHNKIFKINSNKGILSSNHKEKEKGENEKIEKQEKEIKQDEGTEGMGSRNKNEFKIQFLIQNLQYFLPILNQIFNEINNEELNNFLCYKQNNTVFQNKGNVTSTVSHYKYAQRNVLIDSITEILNLIPKIMFQPNVVLNHLSLWTLHLNYNLSQMSFKCLVKCLKLRPKYRFTLINYFVNNLIKIPFNKNKIILFSIKQLEVLLDYWIDLTINQKIENDNKNKMNGEVGGIINKKHTKRKKEFHEIIIQNMKKDELNELLSKKILNSSRSEMDIVLQKKQKKKKKKKF